MIRNPLTLAALIALAAAPLCAADGRVPIAAAPYTISAPGHYYLTSDLTVISGTAITIAAGEVTLDLAGHTVTTTTTTNGNYVIYASAALTGVRITNGRVRGGFYGIYLTGASGGEYRLDRLQVVGSGLAGVQVAASAAPEARVVFEDSEVSVPDTSTYGILIVRATNSRLSRLSVRGGFWPLTLQNSFSTTIENSVFSDAGAACVQLGTGTSAGLQFRNNTLYNCNGDGLYIMANQALVDGNMISFCSGSGIQHRGDNGMITDNLISKCTDYGLRLNSAVGNAVSRNTITGITAGPGIYLQSISPNNTFDWNTVSVNAGAGMSVADAASSGNIYSYNRFVNNAVANNFNVGNVSAGGNNAGGANF